TDVVVEPIRDSGRPAEGDVVVNVVQIVIDRWHVEGAVPHHLGDLFSIHVRGVLDGIGARAYSVFRSVGTVTMHGQTLAVFVREIGGRLHFLERISLIDRDILVR